MKNSILITLLLLSFSGFGQNFIVTPVGIKSSHDTSKSYIVIPVDSLTARQLYYNAQAYINLNMTYPLETIFRQIEGEVLEFDLPIRNVYFRNALNIYRIEYRVCLAFKEGSVRFGIDNFSMKHFNMYGDHDIGLIGDSRNSGLYDKKGELKMPEFKQKIEQALDEDVAGITRYLKGIRDKDPENWWSD